MDLMVARGMEEVGDLVAVLHQEYGSVNIVWLFLNTNSGPSWICTVICTYTVGISQ